MEEDGGDAGEGGAGFSAISLMTVAQTSIPCVPLSTRSPELLKKGLLVNINRGKHMLSVLKWSGMHAYR